MDLFPDLPGFDIEKTRASQFATSVQTSASGKELRATFMTGTPRFEYTLKLNIARRASWADAPQDEILALLRCYNAARGKLNPLLLIDPVNGNTEKVVFATTDGTSTSYQLADDEGWPAKYIQSVDAVDAKGIVFVPAKSRPWITNYTLNTDYLWPITIEFDGADPASIPVTPGETLTITAVGATAFNVNVQVNDGPAGRTRNDAHVGMTLPSSYAGHAATDADWMGLVGAFVDSVGAVIQPVWIGAGATLTVPQGAASLGFGINDDTYYDNRGGYFVKISERPSIESTIPKDSCAYSVDSVSGELVFHTVIPEGTTLKWSGSFARKVRFSDDSLSIKQIVAKLFSGDSIKLVSLK